MAPASRTPEGDWLACPLCGAWVCLEPSPVARDAPCPCCGQLLWLAAPPTGEERSRVAAAAFHRRAGALRFRIGPAGRRVRHRAGEWLAVTCLLLGTASLLAASIVWSPYEEGAWSDLQGGIGLALLVAALVLGKLHEASNRRRLANDD